jgi:hypothetical protein
VIDGDEGAMSVSIFRMGGMWVVRTKAQELGSFESLAEAMSAASNASATGDATADRGSKNLQAV